MTGSPYAALKIRDFQLLVAGRLLGTLALQIQGMAVGWQIYELTKNPLYLGFAGLAEALPALGIALYAGHVADMIDRKKNCCFFSFCTGCQSRVAHSLF